MGDYPSKRPLLELMQCMLHFLVLPCGSPSHLSFFCFAFLFISITALVEMALAATKEVWKDELYIQVVRQLTQNKQKYSLFLPFGVANALISCDL